MTVLKWILVFALFIIYSSFGGAFAAIILMKLYNLIFPIEGFWEYVFSPFSITVFIGLFVAFLGVASLILQIAPNIKIASIIILVLIACFIGIDYFMRWNEIPIIRIAIDFGLIVILILNFNVKRDDQK